MSVRRPHSHHVYFVQYISYLHRARRLLCSPCSHVLERISRELFYYCHDATRHERGGGYRYAAVDARNRLLRWDSVVNFCTQSRTRCRVPRRTEPTDLRWKLIRVGHVEICKRCSPGTAPGVPANVGVDGHLGSHSPSLCVHGPLRPVIIPHLQQSRRC
jgi:hypothetical protein